MEKIKSQSELENELNMQRREFLHTNVESIINKYKRYQREIVNCIASDTYPKEKAQIIVDIGSLEEEIKTAIEETQDKIKEEILKESKKFPDVQEEKINFLYEIYSILKTSNYIISEVTFSHQKNCLQPEFLNEENRIFMTGCLSLAKEYELLRELKFQLEKIEFEKELLSNEDYEIEANYKFYRLFDLYNNLMDLFNLLNNKKVDLKLYELEEENIDIVNIFNALTDYSNVSFT